MAEKTEFIKERDHLSVRSEQSLHEQQMESKFTNRGEDDEDRPIYDELFKKLKRSREG